MPELGEGSRVALLVPGSHEYLDAVMGLLAEGMFPIPLDPRLTAYERERVLSHLEPDLVVEDDAALADLPRSDGLPRARPMHVTSGTTGTPKGVYSGLLDDEQAAALVAEERDLWGFAADDVNLVLSPLYHSAPLRFAMGTVLAGGRVVIRGRSIRPRSRRRSGPSGRRRCSACRPTCSGSSHTGTKRAGPTSRASGWSRTPAPRARAETKRRLIEAFPDGSTWEFYGSTEGQFTACPSEEWLARPGTVGRARPGRTLSVDADGVIWCAVPEHARFSYYGDPEKTAAAWRGDSFTVGDVGRLDDDGYLYLEGRREDLIISGGVNVYPLEVEQILGEHRGVTDVAVYAVDDPEWGQRVCAAVVGDVSEAELTAYAREHLAPPKRPKTWVFHDALPRTLTGKVRRDQLNKRTDAGRPGG